MRSHARLLVVLCSFLLVLTACSGGGLGNTGSDDDTKREQDAVSKDAHDQLDAALKVVAAQPCSTDTKPITAVLDQWGRLQSIGKSTKADVTNIHNGLSQPVRAIGRAFVRGENVGVDLQGLSALAAAAGLDDRVDGWMEDDKCEQNWSVVYDFSAPQVGNGGLLHESGTILITLTGSAVSGSGQVAVDWTVKPAAQCDGYSNTSKATLAVGGTLQNGTFALLLNRGGYTLTAQLVCHFPPPAGDLSMTVPTPFEGVNNFAISVPAKSGVTSTASLGESTLTVTMLRRR